MIKVKEQGMAALKAVLMRRHVILCVAGVLAVVLALWQLLPLIPRTAKPQSYRVGETLIPALTEVVGYRKVTGVTQSLSGMGRAESGVYSYHAGADPMGDLRLYGNWLCESLGAVLVEEQDNRLLLLLPADAEDRQITIELVHSQTGYTVTVDEQRKPKEKQESEHPVNVTPEQAMDLVMSLTKAETGFKADISVYTTTLEEDRASVDGWDYYVFTTVADYSETRIEYRGTFYVGCADGILLRYDKETGETTRIRAGSGIPQEQASQ